MQLQPSWYLADALDWDVEKSNTPYVFTEVSLNKNSYLEKAGNFQLKQNNNYFFEVQQQLFTLTERKYNDLFVCAFDSSHRATIVKKEFTLTMVTER